MMDDSKSPDGPSGPTRKRKHSSTSTSDECVICFDTPKDRGKLSCCEHIFCFDCITKWAKVTNRCPLCKQTFVKVVKTNMAGEKIAGSRSRHIKNRQQNVWYDSDADVADGDAPPARTLYHMQVSFLDAFQQLFPGVNSAEGDEYEQSFIDDSGAGSWGTQDQTYQPQEVTVEEDDWADEVEITYESNPSAPALTAPALTAPAIIAPAAAVDASQFASAVPFGVVHIRQPSLAADGRRCGVATRSSGARLMPAASDAQLEDYECRMQIAMMESRSHVAGGSSNGGASAASSQEGLSLVGVLSPCPGVMAPGPAAEKSRGSAGGSSGARSSAAGHAATAAGHATAAAGYATAAAGHASSSARKRRAGARPPRGHRRVPPALGGSDDDDEPTLVHATSSTLVCTGGGGSPLTTHLRRRIAGQAGSRAPRRSTRSASSSSASGSLGSLAALSSAATACLDEVRRHGDASRDETTTTSAAGGRSVGVASRPVPFPLMRPSSRGADRVVHVASSEWHDAVADDYHDDDVPHYYHGHVDLTSPSPFRRRHRRQARCVLDDTVTHVDEEEAAEATSDAAPLLSSLSPLQLGNHCHDDRNFYDDGDAAAADSDDSIEVIKIKPPPSSLTRVKGLTVSASLSSRSSARCSVTTSVGASSSGCGVSTSVSALSSSGCGVSSRTSSGWLPRTPAPWIVTPATTMTASYDSDGDNDGGRAPSVTSSGASSWASSSSMVTHPGDGDFESPVAPARKGRRTRARSRHLPLWEESSEE